MKRPTNLIDITGHRFTRLTVIGYSHSKDRNSYWLCRCDCGKSVTATKSHLTSGRMKSCGCYSREMSKRNLTSHGLSYHRAYKHWKNMMERCHRPDTHGYEHYGGRGIKVCQEWHDVRSFVAWAESSGFQSGLQLDRRDVNGDYEPDNCRWVTPRQNSNNKRHNTVIEFEGRRLTVAEWAREKGIRPSTIRQRLNAGWSIERVFSPPRKRKSQEGKEGGQHDDRGLQREDPGI